MTYRPYRPSAHAEGRRLEMNLSVGQVELVLNEPEITYPAPTLGRHGNHAGDRTIFARGNIAVVVQNTTGDAVTILWRGLSDYVRPSSDD
jgi:hypothetical protein